MIFGILAACLYLSIITLGLSKVPETEILLYFPLLEVRIEMLTSSLANKALSVFSALPDAGTINLNTYTPGQELVSKSCW